MPFIFHMPPWWPWYLFWGQSYVSYIGEVFLANLWRKMRLLEFSPKKGAKSTTKKYLSPVTDITLSQKEVLRSPGWHMKDNGHTYIFCAIYFFGNKSNLGARLDYIRNVGVVTPHFNSVREKLPSDFGEIFTECLSR